MKKLLSDANFHLDRTRTAELNSNIKTTGKNILTGCALIVHINQKEKDVWEGL
jgi:hypothetical protein